MPEILEVESFRRAAEPVVGRRIRTVHAPDKWYLKGGLDPATVTDALTGRRIEAARRIGKLLLLDTDGPVLGLRFGMTGRLVVDGAAPIDKLEYSSARDLPQWRRFGLDLEPTGGLVISDPRRLGGVELDPDESALGIDATALDPTSLGNVLDGGVAPVKARLMDQARIAGLGNLLTDEILWRAGIDPARPSRTLDADEVEELAARIAEVLEELGRRGGSHTGDLQAHRVVGASCPLDGTPLERRTVGGRTTFSCPAHQR